jgi:Ulp1 family protease
MKPMQLYATVIFLLILVSASKYSRDTNEESRPSSYYRDRDNHGNGHKDKEKDRDKEKEKDPFYNFNHREIRKEKDSHGHNYHESKPVTASDDIFTYIFKYFADQKEHIIDIGYKDLQTLNPNVYLNDNIMNFYMRFIEKELIPGLIKDKSYFFTTYFYSLIESKFQSQTSLKNVNLFDKLSDCKGVTKVTYLYPYYRLQNM